MTEAQDTATAETGADRLDARENGIGKIVGIQGAVVEVWFPRQAPTINTCLLAGPDRQIVIEVASLVDRKTVRGLVMNPMERVALGMEVEDTGGPMKAPVGDGVLGRMIDVFGHPIDGLGPLDNVHYEPIHRRPTPLTQRKPGGEIFQTGIKAIDLLTPIERGGKAGLFGGAGVGKTVLITEIIHNMLIACCCLLICFTIGYKHQAGDLQMESGISGKHRLASLPYTVFTKSMIIYPY